MILPGATIGMLGGGQLGRMFVLAAHTMGYKVAVLDPDPNSPAGLISDQHIHASYTNTRALEQMSQSCVAITTEFENIPTETLQTLEKTTIVRPSSRAVQIAQNRIKEKTFLVDNQFKTAAFFPIVKEEQLKASMQSLDETAILKVASFGYDGKGQVIVNSIDEGVQAFRDLGGVPCVLEEKIELEKEVSVILCRTHQGKISTYPVGENIHVNGILEHTIVPSSVTEAIEQQAISEASRFAQTLNYCGVLAVEFFLTRDNQLLINEVAPRPHNSGHYTIDACQTSQFEQQVRMLCGLPAGSTQLLSPVIMYNILGDAWENGEPDWLSLFKTPEVKLHLYGKAQARKGRKMGHFTCLGESTDELLGLAATLSANLPPR